MDTQGPNLSDLVTLYLEKKRRGESLTWDDICPDHLEKKTDLRRQLQAVVEMEAFLNLSSGGNGIPADRAVGLPKIDAPPLTGQIGDYEIQEELGRGGMGVVYKARQIGLDRIVALKVLRSGAHASARERERLTIEARAVARLRHPNIVQVFDIGEHEGQPFFSMEFIEGGSLLHHLEAGPLAPLQAAELVATVARAVHHAHEHGIVHRDLKPANILLASGGRKPPVGAEATGGLRPPLAELMPRISDFGLAKLLDADMEVSRTGAVQGTPCYMAPEQAAGERNQLGPHTDVWALGVLLFECLTGQIPFRASSMMETLDQVRYLDPVPPSRHRRNVHRDLDTICLKCLAREPHRRYASAAALADDLQHFLNGEPIQARPITWPERVGNWCRRRPTIAALLAVAGVLVAGGLPMGLGVAFHLDSLHQQERAAEERAALAQKAQEAADETAATQEFFALLNQVREGNRAARLGWTEAGSKVLLRAAHLKPAGLFLHDLRTEAAASLGGVDLGSRDVLVDNISPAAQAVSLDGKFLAIGQAKATGFIALGVQLLDLNAKTSQILPVPVGLVVRPIGPVQDGVYTLAFSPNGQRLAAGTRAGKIICWDLRQQPPEKVFWQAHKDHLAFLAFSQDGAAVLSGSADGTVKRWDFQTGDLLAERKLPSKIDGLALHPEGKWLACTSGGHIYWLDVGNLNPIREASPESSYGRACFSPNGKILAVALHDGIDLIHADTGLLIRKLFCPMISCAHVGLIEDLQFNAEGSVLVSASNNDTDRKLKLWETASGQLLLRDVIEGPTSICPVFVPHSPDLIHACGSQVVRREVRGLREHSFLAHHGQVVRGIRLAGDGEVLACVSVRDMVNAAPVGEITLWETAQGRPRGQLDMGGVIPDHYCDRPLAISPNNGHLAVVGSLERDVQIWDLTRRQITARFDGQGVLNLSWMPNGQRLWCDGENMMVQSRAWPTVTTASFWDNQIGHRLTGRGNVIRIHAGNRWVLAGIRNGAVVVLPADARGQLSPEATWEPMASSVRSLALSHDESTAAVGGLNGDLRLMQVPGGRLLAEIKAAHDDSIEQVALTPEGDFLVSGSRDGTVRLWRYKEGRLAPWLTLRFPGPVKDLALSPDTNKLFVLVQNETAVRVWNLEALRKQFSEMGLDSPTD